MSTQTPTVAVPSPAAVGHHSGDGGDGEAAVIPGELDDLLASVGSLLEAMAARHRADSELIAALEHDRQRLIAHNEIYALLARRP